MSWKPKDYTWAEYAALTNKQKAAFADYLGASGFQDWLNRVQGQKETVYPWEKPGAKQPEDYTWEEYSALTEAQKKQTEINMLLSLATQLGNDVMMEQIFAVLDLDYEDYKDKLPKPDMGDPYQAQDDLDAIEAEPAPVVAE